MIKTEKKKFKINKQLATVIMISAGAHLLGGLILGGLTIAKYVIPDEAAFEAPPEVEAEPPEPEVKIEVAPRPAQMNNSMQKLKLQEVRNIAVANLDLNMPNMGDSFTVSAGIGGFGGGGGLLGGAGGGLQLGMSNVNVFGLKTKAERILFVIDASGNMALDAKGGLASYQVIKDEITNMVTNLAAGALFNVAVYNRSQINYFKPKLVPAGSGVAGELKSWISNIQPSPDSGSLGGSRIKLNTFSKADGESYFLQDSIASSSNRPNENMTLTQNILEQGVDAAFLITGYHAGFEGVWRKPTEEENERWERETSRSTYQKALAAYNAEVPLMKERIRTELEKINRERAARGQPPRILNSQWGYRTEASELGLKWDNPHPGFQKQHDMDPRDLISYFKDIVQIRYLDKNADAPSLNVVLFLAGDEELDKASERSLKRYVRLFNGKVRIIRGAAEIRSASSSKGSKN